MTQKIARVVVAILLFVGVYGLAAADPVDDYVASILARKKIPGASVLIVRNGATVKARGYGFANVELGVPASADTVYQSGSTGKQFTAAGILLLAEAGKLSLDDRLSKFYPDAPAAWHRISIRQLLTHTSGIRDYGDADIDQRRDYDEPALLKVMMKLPMDFEPGTQWSYSNSGYLILGLLTSKLAGMHWSDFQEQRLFRPLGMTTTRVISESAIVKNRAAGYELDDKGELKNQEWVAPSLNRCADGSLYYTIKDLAAWDAALRKTRFMSAASFEAWVRPVSLIGGAEYQYGFGWDIDEQRGHRLLEHGGSWQGFRTSIARYVDQDLTVVVLTNLASAEPESMSHIVAGLVEPSLQLPDRAVAPPDLATSRSADLHKLLAAWASSQVDVRMAKGLAETATGSVREAQWRADTGRQLDSETAFRFLAEDKLGAKPIRRRGEAVASIVYYALETKEAWYAYRFYYTGDGRVADFNYEER
jgi:CubicO group peptidase (beta-lactamase class C family)